MAAAEDAGRNVADATHDLYRQYGKQIYAYCLHQLRSREEAEDAVQTTFLNAFRGLQRGTTTRYEQAWLYKIAQNVCIARRSSAGRRLKLEAPDDFEILEEVVPSGTAAGDGDTLELMGLDAALDSMPENQRRAILLREWQGLSYREIADELGLSQGAVEMLIFRARRTLALALEQPDVADKRRTGKAKTGFSFGSLIAAMKSLLSGAGALKMAAVAVSAAVVGTNAIHSIVRTVAPHRHTHRAALAAPLSGGVTAHVASTLSTQLVAFRGTRTHVRSGAPATSVAPTIATASTPGHAPVVVLDTAPSQVPAVTPVAPAPTNNVAAQVAGLSEQAPSHSATPPPPTSAASSGGRSGSSTPPTTGGSGSGSSGSGSGSGSGSSGSGSGSTGSGDSGTTNGGSGGGHHHDGGGHGNGRGHGSRDNGRGSSGDGGGSTGQTTTPGPTAPPDDTTTTTTTNDTTTTTTTTTDATTTTTTNTSTTDTTTTDTTTTDTTTTTTDGGSSSSGGGGHHHGGGDGGDGGNGNGGGGGGGGGNGDGGHGNGHHGH